MPKVVASRNEKRLAATEREKRRMERVNEQLASLKSIVAPDSKSMTKSKILDAVLERILYLEKITGDSLQVQNDHNGLQHQPSAEIQQTVSVSSPAPVSPGSSDQSLDSGYFPDNSEAELQYNQIICHNSENGNQFHEYTSDQYYTTASQHQYYHPYMAYQ